MTDVTLTPAQVRSLACVTANHPDSDVVVYPPVKGCIGVYVFGDDELYLIEQDGTPALEGLAA